LNKIYTEIKFDKENKPLFYYLLLILLTVGLTVTSIGISIFYEIKAGTQKLEEKYSDYNYYGIYDNLVGEYEKIFFEEDNALTKLKSMESLLNKSQLFEYMEIYTQPVDIVKKIPDYFLYGYETESDDRSIWQVTETDGTIKTYYNVKGLWIGKNIQNIFDLTCEEGNLFGQENYQFNSDEIPVILGNDYKDIFKVGDIVQGNTMLNMDMNLKVIGILKKGAVVLYSNQIVNLDRYILLPMVDTQKIPVTEEEASTQNMLLLMKINGEVKTKYSANEIQTEINNICKQAQITPASYVDGATNSQSYMFNISIEKISNMIFGLAAGLIVFAVISLITFILTKIEKNLHYYAILMISGFSLLDIQFIIVGTIVSIVMSAGFITTVISFSFLYLVQISEAFILPLIIICLLTILLTSVIALKKLKQYDICDFLRER